MAEKIKLVMIWHEGVTRTYHKFFKELARHKDLEMHFVIPPYWPSEGGVVKGILKNLFGKYQKFMSQKTYDPDYKIVIKKALLAGKSLHFYPGLWKTLSEINPDLIVVMEEPWTLCTLQTVLWKKFLNKKTKVVFTTFENLSRKYAHPYDRWIERLNFRYADSAIVMDQEMEKTLFKKGFKKNVKTIIGFAFGVNTELYKKMNVTKLKKQLSLNKFTVGYSGRFQKEKGIQILLRAAAKLKKEFDILMLGWGGYKPEIENLVKELGLSEKTKIIDEKLGDQIVPYMNCMDVVVMPSLTTPEWKEQFGRVIPEAMACKIPVIVSTSGSLPWVAGDAALVFKEGDVEDLKNKLEKIMADKKLRQSLIKKGFKRAKNLYDSKKLAHETYKVYKQILNE